MVDENELDDTDYIEEVYERIKDRKKDEELKEREKDAAVDSKVIRSIESVNRREWTKDIYKVDECIERMTLEECVELKRRLSIETLGIRVPRPIGSFLHLVNSVPQALINRLAKLGYIQPTAVQCQAIPCILQGRNTIIISETGSGKTLSYLLPIVVQVLNLIKQWSSVASKRCVYALILTVSRELSYQVYTVLHRLCKGINMRILCISSGVDKTEQYKAVLNGCEIAVCNPGRLLDLISLKGIKLFECNYLVIDECDKMLTKEFEKNTINILSGLRDDVLNVFVSATTTNDIYQKMKSLIRNSITIKVGSSIGINLDLINLQFTVIDNNNLLYKKKWLIDLLRNINSNATGNYGNTPGGESRNTKVPADHLRSSDMLSSAIEIKVNTDLLEGSSLQERIELPEDTFHTSTHPGAVLSAPSVRLNGSNLGQIIIFCNNKLSVLELYNFVLSFDKDNKEFRASIMHGDLNPKDRHDILEDFRKGKYRTLITTDLICRGIDIPSVNCIINYDAPKHYHTLLHRIGRCTRYNTKGKCYTLLNRANNKLAAFITYHFNAHSRSVPKEVSKLAHTFQPFKQAKNMNVNFLQYLNTTEVFSHEKKRGKAKVGLKGSNVGLGFIKTHRGEKRNIEEVKEEEFTGKEYNVDDEISSSSDDNMDI